MREKEGGKKEEVRSLRGSFAALAPRYGTGFGTATRRVAHAPRRFRRGVSPAKPWPNFLLPPFSFLLFFAACGQKTVYAEGKGVVWESY